MSYKTPETVTHTQDIQIWLSCKENLYHHNTMSKHSQIRWVIEHLRQEHILKIQRYDFIVEETYITKSKHSQIRWVIKHLRQEHRPKTQRYDYVVKKLLSQNFLT